MIHEHEYVCPRCGSVLGSLTEFYRHYAKEHGHG